MSGTKRILDTYKFSYSLMGPELIKKCPFFQLRPVVSFFLLRCVVFDKRDGNNKRKKSGGDENEV